MIALHLPPQAQPALSDMLAETAEPAATLPIAFTGHAQQLAPLTAEGQRGISVVTCSMNRCENLIKAMPSWLSHPQISEVVVVDWSSRQPVRQDLAQAGITDPRIRILRVEDEARWILSYAFNAGFRAAACDTILKVDADIVLGPDFFQRNRVAKASFIAGNWRTSSDDQAHVNGFFFTSRKALHLVGGFNEHITTYGWDDDDIYDRMTLAGLRRRDVAPDTIFHLDHDDEGRLGEAGQAGVLTLGAALTAGTRFMIRRNRYLAQVMPAWDAAATHLPFRVLDQSASLMTVRRQGWVPSLVAPDVLAAGRIHALTELLAWRLGRRVFELEPARIERLMARSNDAVLRIDVEVALAAPGHLAPGSGRYLVLDMTADLLSGALYAQGLATAFAALIHAARTRGLTPVLRAPYAALPHQAPRCLTEIPLIPAWQPVGPVARLTADSLFAEPPAAGQDFAIDLTFEVLAALSFATPALMLARPRLFLDAQHGLGNHLRALGSAAAIAAASDRELVVVWQPDDHCDGRFSDLFNYKGAVIQQRFIDTASGCDIYNYMPNEPGAEKDAPIRLDSNRDIYAIAVRPGDVLVVADTPGFVALAQGLARTRYLLRKVGVGGVHLPIFKYLLKMLLDQNPCDLVIIEIGTPGWRWSDPDQPAAYASHFADVVGFFKSRGQAVAFWDLPNARYLDGPDTHHDSHRAICEQAGLPYRRTPFKADNLRDNVHASAEGHKYYAGELLQFLDLIDNDHSVLQHHHRFAGLAPICNCDAIPVPALWPNPDIVVEKFARSGLTVDLVALDPGTPLTLTIAENWAIGRAVFQQLDAIPDVALLRGQADLGPRCGYVGHLLVTRKEGPT